MWAGGGLVLYFILFLLAHDFYKRSNAQRAEYKAAVASLHGRLHESMSESDVNLMTKTLVEVKRGGAQPLLGLSFEALPLNEFLGEDAFDLDAVIALLEARRIQPAQTKLKLLVTKVARVQARHSRLLSYMSYAGITGASLLGLYLLYMGWRLKRNWHKEITVLSDRGAVPLLPKSFEEYLQAVVNEEVAFTGHYADVVLHGVQTKQLPESLSLVVEQLVEQLVRNSIEHGGRPADERVMAGKSERLAIHVTIKDQVDHYVVSVADDGEGIDLAGVIKRARELRLITQEAADSMPLDQAARLIFLADFHGPNRPTSLSENDQSLSELRLLVTSIGGVFSIQNIAGKHCQFTVKFPKDAIPSESEQSVP